MAVRFLEPYMSQLTQRKIYHEGKVGEFEKAIEAELVRIGVAEFVKAEDGEMVDLRYPAGVSNTHLASTQYAPVEVKSVIKKEKPAKKK